ncbi:MAG: hypothetical protein ACI8Y4_000083 [Candidatus Poriferisodalaceae bacterium]|jgi:glycosyltransferase 2 family protein
MTAATKTPSAYRRSVEGPTGRRQRAPTTLAWCRSLVGLVENHIGKRPGRRIPKEIALTLRIAVSTAMLTVLIARIPTHEVGDLWPEWNLALWGWFCGAFAATAGAFVLSAIRWHAVAQTLGLASSVPRLLSHYLAGQFVGNFLPTTIGGDVLRISRLGRDTGDRPNAFASVVIERLTGWIVLPLMTIAALVINRGLLEQAGARMALIVSIGTLVLLLAVVYVAEHPRVGGRMTGVGQIRRGLGAMHLALGTYRGHRQAATRLIAIGAIYQLMLVIATAFAAAAIGIRPGPTAWLAFVPMVLIVQVLPISIGGLGLREGALVFFLSPYGVSDGEAVLLGLVLYLLNLIASLAGAPSFAVGNRVPAEPEVLV